MCRKPHTPAPLTVPLLPESRPAQRRGRCRIQRLRQSLTSLDDLALAMDRLEVTVQVSADAPDESNCPLAIELATAAVGQLPQG